MIGKDSVIWIVTGTVLTLAGAGYELWAKHRGPSSREVSQVAPRANQYDDANAEIRLIVQQIRSDGPVQLRQLTDSQIEATAASFVHGRRSGLFSEAQLSRMGGVRKATEDALMGTLKMNGLL
ncbi:MAG: hypothetical protein K0S79_156 [Nitrospira sp.]|jgi:hypothetical protein|nr:hypothetical protein [Nitrospira sp.]